MPGFLVGVGKAGDVAERSPAVISANLKEDMLLQKKLVILNRSERSVVHQIKVDQKVMYKRFQARLTCSKLAHARLMGQRELQMQLRAKTLGTLNTDIAGNSDEDYAFLVKLEQRPCTTSSFSPRSEYKPPPLKQNIQPKPESKLEEPSKQATKLNNGRSSSAKARCRENNVTGEKTKGSNIIRPCGERAVTLRPATTLGTRVEDDFNRHQQDVAAHEKESYSSSGGNDEEKDIGISESLSSTRIYKQDGGNKNDSSDKNSETSDVNGGKSKYKPNVAFLENLDFGDARPKTAADLTQWDNSIPSSPTSPKQLSRRASRAADFFQAEEKVDLVALRLQEAKTLDFTDNVHQFCKELEEMKCAHTSPDVDYYSMRLQLAFDQVHSKPLVEVPGTPDDENKRSMGDVFVKSLTLPPINFYDN
ncbi:uncharacterized protein LOC123545076 [Mercenaria mercenaria]|uniref:uncharacterized protein LOC123545076 n=1 Tax=Mercenaria mercenaria TaxID=6596 RepID=UPI00234E4194|nr:uncharacterized protein LOC123545076 [Mercenaria mercenaria]